MFVKLKSEELEVLPFVSHAVIVDGTVKSVELKTEQGIFLVSYETYGSGLTISRTKPDEFAKRWVVSGKAHGIPIVDQIFEDKRLAEAATTGAGMEVTIEEREINITKNPQTSDQSMDDYIPF